MAAFCTFLMPAIWVLVTLLFSSFSIAEPPAQTRSYCTTSFTTTSTSSVPTLNWSLTTTRHPSVVVTSTAVQTITPAPVTTTRTSTTTITTVTTAPNGINCTSTIYVEVGGTVYAPATTSTIYSTVSTTVTRDAGTSTIPTRAGFVPLQTSAPQVTFQNAPARAREEPPEVPIREVALDQGPVVALAPKYGHPHAAKRQAASSTYPHEVRCVALVTSYQATTSTVTASSTITRTGTPSTITSTRLVSTTCTSTAGEHHWTGTTITTTEAPVTVTPTSTQRVTNTATVTYTHPSATVHAQCASNNFGNTLRGEYGVTVGSMHPEHPFSRLNGTSTAAECCERCASEQDCGFSAFNPRDSACWLLNATGFQLAVISDSEAKQYWHYPDSLAEAFVLSNGGINAVTCPQRGQSCIS